MPLTNAERQARFRQRKRLNALKAESAVRATLLNNPQVEMALHVLNAALVEMLTSGANKKDDNNSLNLDFIRKWKEALKQQNAKKTESA